MDLNQFKQEIKNKTKDLFVTIIDPETKKKIFFSIHNETTLWRAQSLYTKEPVTISWIRGFEHDSIFYDIGANIGIYSIFAATINKINVLAFEPESNNFQILMENIIKNNLNDRIIAYPLGISNQTEITSLFLSQFTKAGSHHMIKKNLDHNLKERAIGFRQGIFTTSLNDLIVRWNLPIPNYLKIDVDGIEYKIIEESDLLLKNKNLKSILIEINPNRKEDLNIIKILNKFDFEYDKSQVELSTRKSGPHKGYAEYLFYRI